LNTSAKNVEQQIPCRQYFHGYICGSLEKQSCAEILFSDDAKHAAAQALLVPHLDVLSK
jgi:hypothetical protein